MTFIDDAHVSPLGATTYVATLAPTWRSMLDIHGGYVAAIAARAVECTIDNPTRPLRSFTTQFVRPAHDGPISIDIDVTKAGRSASFVRAVVTQDQRPVLTAAAIAGAGRGGLAFNDLAPPPGALTPPPDGTERFTAGQPGFHFEQLDIRLAPGLTIFGAHDRARVAGWIRPLDSSDSITLPWMICVADLLPPSMVFRTDRSVAAASIEMAVQLVHSQPAAAIGTSGHVYADISCAVSAEGFSVEDGTFWTNSGQLLATSRQVRLAGA